MSTSGRAIVLLLAVLACTCGGFPEGLDCNASDQCGEGSVCLIALDEGAQYYDLDGPGLTGGDRCNLVEAGRCTPGTILLSCYCYFGPHPTLPILPADERGHLVCAD